jgi:FkbM family methyltransferase
VRGGTLAGCVIHAPFEERLAFGLGTYEAEVAAEFEALAVEGAVVYDVGAHIGFYTMVAAKKGARVFAFEANPKNVDQLKSNIEVNAFGAQATIVPMAVSDHSGTLSFATYGYSLVGGIADADTKSDAIIIEVPCLSLDAFSDGANPPPTLIKIDVEGAEGVVIRGALAVLRSHKPVLIVEMHSDEQRKIVQELTKPIGYEWTRIDGSSFELRLDEVGQFLGKALS